MSVWQRCVYDKSVHMTEMFIWLYDYMIKMAYLTCFDYIALYAMFALVNNYARSDMDM